MAKDYRVSLASSDASSLRRLKDVGDLQNLAKLQEEGMSRLFFSLNTFNPISPLKGLTPFRVKCLWELSVVQAI